MASAITVNLIYARGGLGLDDEARAVAEVLRGAGFRVSCPRPIFRRGDGSLALKRSVLIRLVRLMVYSPLTAYFIQRDMNLFLGRVERPMIRMARYQVLMPCGLPVTDRKRYLLKVMDLVVCRDEKEERVFSGAGCRIVVGGAGKLPEFLEGLVDQA